MTNQEPKDEEIDKDPSINSLLAWFQVEIMRWCEKQIKDSRPAFYKTSHALTDLLDKRVKEAKIDHLTDLSRAVGILEGMGYPDALLIKQREKLLAELELKR